MHSPAELSCTLLSNLPAIRTFRLSRFPSVFCTPHIPLFPFRRVSAHRTPQVSASAQFSRLQPFHHACGYYIHQVSCPHNFPPCNVPPFHHASNRYTQRTRIFRFFYLPSCGTFLLFFHHSACVMRDRSRILIKNNISAIIPLFSEYSKQSHCHLLLFSLQRHRNHYKITANRH